MDFKTVNLRAIILLGIAVIMLLGMVMARMRPQASGPDSKLAVLLSEPGQVLPLRPVVRKPLKEVTEEDSQTMKEMKEQMDADRLQQKKIKSLKLRLEQTNLQLEEDKAMSEIGRLEKENTGIVNEANDAQGGRYPAVKVVYIGGSGQNKQAILSINGENYSVKEKNKPVKNMEVTAISDTGVTLHFNLPQDLKTTVEYKPE